MTISATLLSTTTNLTHESSTTPLSSTTLSSSPSSATTQKKNAKYAYAFLLAGCDPAHPQQYRGILYGILVHLEILEQSNSTADAIIYVQMSHLSPTPTLPAEDVALLQAYAPRVHIFYIPQPTNPTSFYQVQFEKFRILNLLQYRRVIYMDADVMPLCSLDYWFTLSEEGVVLKPTVIVAGDSEPSNGGLFMVQPQQGDYEHVQHIIATRDALAIQHAGNKTYLETMGWGHVIMPPDIWKGRLPGKRGHLWNFYAAFADQGLVYHWAKYVKRNATILLSSQAEHWTSYYNDSTNTTISVLESKVRNPLKGHGCWYQQPPEVQRVMGHSTDFVHREIFHFWGPFHKPWNLKMYLDPSKPRFDRIRQFMKVWHGYFDRVKQRCNITWDVNEVLRNGNTSFDPPLGAWSTEEDFQKTLKMG